MSLSKLDVLIAHHCETLKEMMNELTKLYRQGSSSGPPDAHTMGVLHKIKGSSGTIGFMNVNVAATSLEELLQASAANGWERDAYRGEIEERLMSLENLVREIQPEQSSLFGRKI